MTGGTILSYDPDEGEGYVEPDEHDDRIPFDRESLVGYRRNEHPHPGDRVSFEVEGGMAGLWAKNVRPIEKADAR